MNTLYEQCCLKENLINAWLTIKEKGSAGGIDNMSIDGFSRDLESNLQSIHDELLSRTYSPEPYKQIAIPKDDYEVRRLAMLTIRDKIIQQSVRMVIEPILDKKFLNVSYAYRPGKSPYQAIRRILHHLNSEKRKFICLCDIDRYFDNIPHDRLFNRIKKVIPDEEILRLIEIWVRMGSLDSSLKWQEKTSGIPQGGVLSPLLSNLYLHPFDQVMVNNKYGYVRYADDFLTLTYNRQQAESALKAIEKTLNLQHGLQLNHDKRIVHADEGFKFLGVSIIGGKIELDLEKYAELLARLEEAIRIRDGSLDPDFHLKIKGIRQYYARLIPKATLEKMDRDFAGILKKKLQQAYSNKQIAFKYQLEAILSGIEFFSEPFRSNQDQVRKEITQYVYSPCQEEKPALKKQHTLKKSPEEVIEARRMEYRDLETQGFELVIDSFGVFVGKTQNLITVKDHGKTIQKVKTNALKNITIMSQGVSFSSNVIRFCSEKNIPIDFLTNDGKPYAKLYYPSYASVAANIEQIKAFTNGKGMEFILTNIRAKIRNQLNLLKYYSKYRSGKDPEFARAFSDKTKKMLKISVEIEKLQDLEPDEIRQKVFGFEGITSGMYWEIIYEILNDYSDFKKREKQGATDLVNNMLNYGYGILYSRVWQVLMKSGLSPWIGYLHSTEREHPALVFDFIEQFRQQAVDRVVIAMITKGEKNEVEDGKLTNETRKRLATKVLERLHRDEEFRGHQKRFSEIMQFQADHLVDFLSGTVKTYKPYIAKW